VTGLDYPSDPSVKEMGKDASGDKNTEVTYESARNISTLNGEGKDPKKTLGFTKRNKKSKGVPKNIEGQVGIDTTGKPAKKKAKPGLAEKYKNFCFRFGIYFDKNPQTDLAKSLYQADVEITPGMFISLAIITSLIVTTFMFIFSIVMFYGMPNYLVYVFSLTFLTLGLCLGGFPFSLYNKVSNKDMNIQYEIPFALSYMSVLASGGSQPLEIIKRVALEDYGDISKELSKVVYRIDVLGEDGNSAMSYLIQNTSSEHLRAVCIDISNAMQAGGGLQTYLEMKSKELMEMRRQAQKAFIDSLSIYGEGYLSGIVMSVVLVVLMIVICSALGVDLKIMTPHQMFNFFIYFALPFINLIFVLMLWMKYSRSAV
jgi:archaeal flagellar protein FlaJ